MREELKKNKDENDIDCGSYSFIPYKKSKKKRI